MRGRASTGRRLGWLFQRAQRLNPSDRLFEQPESAEGVLLGDYLYAHGLVRVAEAGGVPAVAALAELIARCAAERADGQPDDGLAWVDAARALGGSPDDEAVAHALARHSARVGS